MIGIFIMLSLVKFPIHTERIIMDEIKKFIGKKTITMIVHRLKTIDSGNYKELMNKNQHFKKLAKHS